MRIATKKRWFNYAILACVAAMMAFILAQGYAHADERVGREANPERPIVPS